MTRPETVSSKRDLERRLAEIDGFDEPRVELEQYPTPAGLASTLIHLADMNDDLDGTVLDLGCGTGVLAIGAALRGARRVIGLDRDRDALRIARRNAAALGAGEALEWVCGDATRAPIGDGTGVTVLMNPPFGAQKGNEHADRDFLRTVARVASVSYSIHNAGSFEFVEAFTPDNAGRITQAYGAELDLDRRFSFHDDDHHTIDVEVFRVEWKGPDHS